MYTPNAMNWIEWRNKRSEILMEYLKYRLLREDEWSNDHSNNNDDDDDVIVNNNDDNDVIDDVNSNNNHDDDNDDAEHDHNNDNSPPKRPRRVQSASESAVQQVPNDDVAVALDNDRTHNDDNDDDDEHNNDENDNENDWGMETQQQQQPWPPHQPAGLETQQESSFCSSSSSSSGLLLLPQLTLVAKAGATSQPARAPVMGRNNNKSSSNKSSNNNNRFWRTPHIDDTVHHVEYLADVNLWTHTASLHLCTVTKSWTVRACARRAVQRAAARPHPIYLSPTAPWSQQPLPRLARQYCDEDGPLSTCYQRVLPLELKQVVTQSSELRRRAEHSMMISTTSTSTGTGDDAHDHHNYYRVKVFLYNAYATAVHDLLQQRPRCGDASYLNAHVLMRLQNVPARSILPFPPTDWFDSLDLTDICVCIGDESNIKMIWEQNDEQEPEMVRFDDPNLSLSVGWPERVTTTPNTTATEEIVRVREWEIRIDADGMVVVHETTTAAADQTNGPLQQEYRAYLRQKQQQQQVQPHQVQPHARSSSTAAVAASVPSPPPVPTATAAPAASTQSTTQPPPSMPQPKKNGLHCDLLKAFGVDLQAEEEELGTAAGRHGNVERTTAKLTRGNGSEQMPTETQPHSKATGVPSSSHRKRQRAYNASYSKLVSEVVLVKPYIGAGNQSVVSLCSGRAN